MLIHVKCSKCGWKKEDQDPLDWWHKPCPECKAKYIIDKEDMDMYRGLKMAEDEGQISDIKDENDNIIGMKISVDSADLKEGNSFTCFKCGEKFPLMLKSPMTKGSCLICDLKKFSDNK